jgi:hypothetical protein
MFIQARALPLALAMAVAAAGFTHAHELSADRAERERLAEAVLQRAELAMRREFDPTFRDLARARLAGLPLEELQAREARDASAGLGPLGTTPPDLVYRSVTPCRLIDTRSGGGSLAAGSPRDFRVTGTDFTAQGGNPAGCAVPIGGATAAVINFVAVNPVGAGDLRAWAYSQPPVTPPNASIVNYIPIPGIPAGSPNLNIANGVVIPLCDPALSACPFDFKAQADVSSTHLVADVLGYFTVLHKPFLVAVPALSADTSVPALTCTTVTGGSVTINAPAAGQVEVRGMVSVRLAHTTSIDLMNLHFAASPADCNFNAGYAQAWVQGNQPAGNYIITVPVSRIFAVTAGTHTFYLNANMESGGDPLDVVQGNLRESAIQATFYPN